jgi:hypothetical protein
MNTQSFIPGAGETTSFPLGRFLPPVTTGTTAAWLKENVPPGSWILDPIGFTPVLALEAARAGYFVLVACNNPVINLMFEVLASAPGKETMQSALAELSLLKRGDERLDTHLQSLYQTTCPSCKQPVQAQAFLWKRGDKEPYTRLIHCPHCGEEGEHPLTPEDLSRLTLPGNSALHRARAIERVSLQDDEIRPGVEEALRTYLPRSLYFITTLINKIEGADFSHDQRKLLLALVLTICDEGNSLWPWPSGRTRPRQLTTPPQFRENNLWLSLEEAAQTWSSQTLPVILTNWPDLPVQSSQVSQQGGICLYHGRLKSLLPLPANLVTVAAITAFPRPSQAFWTLSAIWSGWIWGREAVQPLKAALDRRRYDWDWHATALHSTFSTLFAHVPVEYPVFGIMPESVPGFLGAMVLAAESGGFKLCGLALREDDAMAQFCLSRSDNSIDLHPVPDLAVLIETALIKTLQERREPASYLILYTAGLLAVANGNAFPFSPQANLHYFSDLSNKFEATFHKILRNPRVFRRFHGSEQNDESGVWWLRDPIQPQILEKDDQFPLSDRIEKELVQYLQKKPNCQFEAVETELCRIFPGLLTPAEDFLQICLESYGMTTLREGKEFWQLRPEDEPAARRRDLQSLQPSLVDLAKKMGLDCSGDLPIFWESPPGKQIYAFYPIASSIISRFVLTLRETSAQHRVIILPGGRSKLLAFKLRRDPHLAEYARGWNFLKFRNLRQFLEQKTFDLPGFEYLLDSEPPDLDTARQMTLFDT